MTKLYIVALVAFEKYHFSKNVFYFLGFYIFI